MSGDTMVARAKKLVDDGDVEYMNTNGNTHYFVGRGHNVSKEKDYGITAEIQLNGEIEWSCDCHHAQFNDECKHMLACSMIVVKKELRVEFNDRIDVLSADKDSDVIVSKVKIEKDDD